jgi:hypothetical protein
MKLKYSTHQLNGFWFVLSGRTVFGRYSSLPKAEQACLQAASHHANGRILPDQLNGGGPDGWNGVVPGMTLKP